MNSLISKRGINMDGSSDPFCRYRMPAVVVKHEGKGKMKKSVIVNISEVSKSVGRPADYIMTYLGQQLNASAKVEKDITLSYVAGHHGHADVQDQVLHFIQDAVMCRVCRDPGTSCNIEGSKKRQQLFLRCKACGKRSDLDPTDRLVKYMISHPIEDGACGQTKKHAATETATAAANTRKRHCPNCNHKTSKSTCGKCGATVALEPCAEDACYDKAEEITKVEEKAKKNKKECPNCHHKTSKAVCSKCGLDIQEHGGAAQSAETNDVDDVADDLLGTTRLWMQALEASHDKISFEDYRAHVKTPGFTQSTPLDCFGAIVQVIASSVSTTFHVETPKLQPMKVAEKTKPHIDRWSSLMELLMSNAGDYRAVVDVLISTVHEAVACALSAEAHAAAGDTVVVGLLLAFKDLDGVSDGLLDGCCRLQARSMSVCFSTASALCSLCLKNDSKENSESPRIGTGRRECHRPSASAEFGDYTSLILRSDCPRVRQAVRRTKVIAKASELVLAMGSTMKWNGDVVRWANTHGLKETRTIQFMPLHVERAGQMITVTVVSILPEHVAEVSSQGWVLEKRYGQHFLAADQTKFEDRAVPDHKTFVSERLFVSFGNTLADKGLADKARDMYLYQDDDFLLKLHSPQPELPGGVRNPDYEDGWDRVWTVSIKDDKPPEVLKVALIDDKAVLIPWNPSAADVCKQPNEFESREAWEEARMFEFHHAHFILNEDVRLEKSATTLRTRIKL